MCSYTATMTGSGQRARRHGKAKALVVSRIGQPSVGERLLQFLELLGVGRMMDNGKTKRKPRPLGWTGVLYGRRERHRRQTDNCSSLLFLPYMFLLRGNSDPELCAQRDAEGGGTSMSWLVVGTVAGSPLSFLGASYISLRDERLRRHYLTNEVSLIETFVYYNYFVIQKLSKLNQFVNH
jgi:hypothetical protein